MDTIEQITINMKELTGKSLKKALGAKSCSYRWHNRNKSGGNFGINILGIDGIDYELSGNYGVSGNVYGLRFGLIFRCGVRIDSEKLTDLYELINKIIEDYRVPKVNS